MIKQKLILKLRPKLENQGYILQRVLGPAIHRGINTRDYDLLWKLFGYLLGVNVLDYAISGTTIKKCVVPDGDVERVWAQAHSQGYKQLAGAAAEDAVLLADFVELAAACDAEPGFEAARGVVEAGVDDLAVS